MAQKREVQIYLLHWTRYNDHSFLHRANTPSGVGKWHQCGASSRRVPQTPLNTAMICGVLEGVLSTLLGAQPHQRH